MLSQRPCHLAALTRNAGLSGWPRLFPGSGLPHDESTGWSILPCPPRPVPLPVSFRPPLLYCSLPARLHRALVRSWPVKTGVVRDSWRGHESIPLVCQSNWLLNRAPGCSAAERSRPLGGPSVCGSVERRRWTFGTNKSRATTQVFSFDSAGVDSRPSQAYSRVAPSLTVPCRDLDDFLSLFVIGPTTQQRLLGLLDAHSLHTCRASPLPRDGRTQMVPTQLRNSYW